VSGGAFLSTRAAPGINNNNNNKLAAMRREIKAIKFGGLRSILFNHFSNPLSHQEKAWDTRGKKIKINFFCSGVVLQSHHTTL
jgi:hypothetical protein